MRAPIVFLALLSASALAKPWNGIDPGTSKREDVVKKFGEPTKSVPSEGKEVIAYLGKQLIKGTTQAQFRVDATTKVVERIDVFPGPVIDRESVENSYGPACPAGAQPEGPCYVKKVTDDFQTYFQYPKLGLAVFLNTDGKTVQSFIYTAPKTK